MLTRAGSAISAAQRNRDTLFLEHAQLLRVRTYPGDQFVMRLHAPRCAAAATAGSFVHIQCSKDIAMRRPLSIMRADAAAGWIDILFKVVGTGLRALGEAKVGDSLSVIGPIGHGFTPTEQRPVAVMIGGGVGIPPMVFLAEQLLALDTGYRPVVFMGSEITFPFEVVSASVSAEWAPGDIDSSMRLLDQWGVCARLASLSGFAGCYNGYVTDLTRVFLQHLSEEDLARTELFACGPTPMLKAAAALAAEFDRPCQVSLEEFMACAVGGCAGCAVEVQTERGRAMKRVCVDGPVFDASKVFPAAPA